jgi:hypothetical protein
VMPEFGGPGVSYADDASPTPCGFR